MELTRIEAETLEALWTHLSEQGHHPSMRELADRLGLRSPSTAHARVRSLERRGCIRRVPGHARAMELLTVPASLSVGT